MKSDESVYILSILHGGAGTFKIPDNHRPLPSLDLAAPTNKGRNIPEEQKRMTAVDKGR